MKILTKSWVTGSAFSAGTATQRNYSACSIVWAILTALQQELKY